MTRWWVRLARYALPRWRGLAALSALMLIGVGVDVLKPWPMKLVFDNVLAGKPSPWLGNLAPIASLAVLTAATVLLFLAGWGLQALQSYAQTIVGNHMAYDLGERLFDHLQRQSLRFHGRHRTGDLVRRVMTDTACVRGLILWGLLPAATSIISVAAMISILWRLDWTLSLVALAAAPLLLVLIRLFAGPMSERTYRQQQLEGELSAVAEQTLTSLAIVQAFGREEHEDRRFRGLSSQAVNAQLRVTMSSLQFKVGTTAVTACGTAAVVLIGGSHVLHGTLTFGGLLVFLAYLAAMYVPMETLAYTASQFAAAAAGARRVFEVLDASDAVVEKPNAVAPPSNQAAAHVRIEHVTFGYEADRPVLTDVSVEAKSGEMVALVGPTGAGKSTLVSLVPRFFDPWQGRVTLGGVDVRDISLTGLRSKVSLVLQEPFLLPVTVAENIAYGRPGASMEEVIAAAIAADAHGFIAELPHGYNTVLGERGATLSGGQRQRLSIARAILKDAPVLILDEPTSALDAQTEASVLAALERLMAKRTILVIAHRLSTVRRADKIVVLEHGRVVEQGTHDQLLAAAGAYHKLYQLQFAGKHP